MDQQNNATLTSSRREYIEAAKARKELGEQNYFQLHKWLVEKGYRNLNDVFITREQLTEYVKEQLKKESGQDLNVMWGQTREYYNGQPRTKHK